MKKLKKIHSLLITPIRFFFYKTNNIWIFRKLGILIYKIGLFTTLQIFKRMPEIEAIYTKTKFDKDFIPGESDIDLVIIFEKKHTKEEINILKKFYNTRIIIKTFFPFFNHMPTFFNPIFAKYQKNNHLKIVKKNKNFNSWKLLYGTEKRIDILSTVIHFGGTVFDLEKLEISYAPPYNNAKAAVNNVGYVASNLLRGDLPYWHWEDAEELIDKKKYLLDVRREDEYSNGTIGDAINIDDLELREKIEMLPKEEEIYLFCEEGYRAYIVARNLMQRGYKVKNLIGGYIFYKMANATQEELKQRIAFNNNEKNKD